MPLPQPAAPGVYLNELPPNVPQQITAATTSVTAFPGVYPKGPVGTALLVESWDDFVSNYGGLDETSSLAALAVWQFFNNGGGSAYIVRLPAPGMASATGSIGGVFLTALQQGTSADNWQVSLAPSASVGLVDLTTTNVTNPADPVDLETLPGLPNEPAALAAAITAQSSYLSAEEDDSGGSSQYVPPPAAVGFPNGVATFGGVTLVEEPAWAAAATVTVEPDTAGHRNLVVNVGGVDLWSAEGLSATSGDAFADDLNAKAGPLTATASGEWTKPEKSVTVPMTGPDPALGTYSAVIGETVTLRTAHGPWDLVTVAFTGVKTSATMTVTSVAYDMPLVVRKNVDLTQAEDAIASLSSAYLTAHGKDLSGVTVPGKATWDPASGVFTSGGLTLTPGQAPPALTNVTLQAQVASAAAETLDLAVTGTTPQGRTVVLDTYSDVTPNGLETTINAAPTPPNVSVLTVTGSAGDLYQFPPAPVRLSGGNDGNWSPPDTARETLEAALLAQFGKSTSLPVPLPALDQIAPNVFNLMCVPDVVYLDAPAQVGVLSAAQQYCAQHQAFLIVDTPAPVGTPPSSLFGGPTLLVPPLGDDAARQVFLTSEWCSALLGPNSYNSATYYPWVEIPNPVLAAGAEPQIAVPPSGTMAGVYATTDAGPGVWKAPAGTLATMSGVLALDDKTLNDGVNADLNSAGINCLRHFVPWGNIVWGARTMAGADLIQSPWKYLSVRRLADFIEQSLLQSLRWAVFEPNGPTLWAAIAMEVNAFMGALYARGAFFGATTAAAYQVVCDGTTTSNADIQAGIVRCYIGFTASQPAEFVVLNVQLNAGPATAAAS